MSLPIAPTYVQGSDLPDLTWIWKDGSKNIIDLTAYTFVLKVGQPGTAAAFTKSSGIVGASISPNLTIAWSTTGELNTLAAGRYIADLIATRASDSKQRVLRFILPVEAAIS